MPREKPWHKMTAGERESTVQDAVSVIRRDYYDDVKGVADNIMERLKEEYESDVRGEQLREVLIESMHETIDAQGRVMYTFQAKLGLLVTDNAGTYLEEYGAEGALLGDDINWSALMFAAMERDVYEELDRRGFDVNDPESFFEED